MYKSTEWHGKWVVTYFDATLIWETVQIMQKLQFGTNRLELPLQHQGGDNFAKWKIAQEYHGLTNKQS